MLFAAGSVPATAEIVYLNNGRTMSVASHRRAGDRIVLMLRSGGEIHCEASLVARIEPDEVPDEAPSAGSPAGEQGAGQAELPFGVIVDRAARQTGLSPALLHAVIQVESGYQPRARSPKGARGLMQLMPAVLAEYGVEDPYNPEANVAAGAQHLRRLLERYPLARALAAYNAGEGAVERHDGIPPFPETRAYVQRVLALVGRAGGGAAVGVAHAGPPR